MTRSREHAVEDLRRALETLPTRTRQAMLIGLENNTVIAGAFSTSGGACPMLAAHRAGGRTSCSSFPDAWDRFTGVYGRQIVRPATEYEVQVLRQEIVASLEQPKETELSLAIAEHQAAVEARRRRERYAAGDPVDLAAAIEEHAHAKRRRRFETEAIDLRAAIEEHKSTSRRRRRDEAEEVGLDWLFESTLVLPEDFDGEREVETGFDFDAAETELLR